MNPPLVQKLKKYLQDHTNGKKLINQLTGIGEVAINNILAGEAGKHKPSVINRLYDFFRLPRDEWYSENMRKWKIKSGDVLGDFFFELRVRSRKTMDEVLQDLRNIDRNTLERLENWRTFHHYNSYTILKLIEYYGLSEEEKHTILWYLSINQEVRLMYKKLLDDVGKNDREDTVSSWAKK